MATLSQLALCSVATVLLVYVIKLVIQMCVQIHYVRKIPGPPTHSWLLGNYRPLMRITSETLFQKTRDFCREYYPIFHLWTPILCIINIVNPEDAALILSDTKHLKKGINYNGLTKWLKSGLLLSDGEKWSQRRKILTPAFHFKILQDFIATFNKKTQELVEVLEQETKKPFTEVNEPILSCTLGIILETAIGLKVEKNIEKCITYKHALHDLGKLLVERVMKPYLLFNWSYIFTPIFFKEIGTVRVLHGFTKEVIAEKEQKIQSNVADKKKRLALLDLLLTLKKEGSIDSAGIQEEVDTFVFEGHDTISIAISFGLMAIACDIKVQNNIVQEMHQVLGDIRKQPSFNDLQELKYMERCIKEILRLYPSAPLISRKLSEDHVTHDGYLVKKGTLAVLHIFDHHRNPRIFPDPEKFDPDRFLPENSKDRHPYAYIPFSAGPRNCIGQRFAMFEMKAILCGILGNFVLEPVDTPENITFIVDFVLRTKESLKVRFIQRLE